MKQNHDTVKWAQNYNTPKMHLVQPADLDCLLAENTVNQPLIIGVKLL